MTKSWWAQGFVALLLTLGLAGPVVATNGVKPVWFGARAGARGGVDYAIAGDATALATNPAGIAFIDGQRFDQTIFAVIPSVDLRGPVDSASSEITLPLVAGSMGFVFDLDEPWQLGEALDFEDSAEPVHPSRFYPEYGVAPDTGSGLKFGFGVFPVAGSKIDFEYSTPFWDDNNDPTNPVGREEVDWQSDLQELAVTAGIAWRISEFVSIGFAPSFIYSKLETDSPVAQPVSFLQGHPLTNTPQAGDLTYADLAPALGVTQIQGFGDLDDLSTFGFRFRTGLMLHPTEWLSIGLTYASQSWKQDYLGEATVDFDRQLRLLANRQVAGVLAGNTLQAMVETNTGIPVADQSYAGSGNARLSPFNAPQEIGLGVAVTLDRFMFGVDLTWINWSATFDKATIKVDNLTSAELNELVGDLSTSQTINIPLNWDDQIVIAVGGAFAVNEHLVLRAGYNYAKNPVPNNTLLPTTPAVLEQHVTGGLSVYYKRLEVSLVVEYALPTTVTIGGSQLVNESLAGTEVTISALLVGLGFGVRF